jgi:ribosome-associated protein
MKWQDLLQIALGEGTWEFSRSSGPGGQNVNKVESRAVFRWNMENSPYFSAKLARYLTKSGDILVGSDRFRDREQNRRDVVEKLKDLFENAFYEAPPRKKTKVPKSAHRKRMDKKTKRKEIKQTRKKVSY